MFLSQGCSIWSHYQLDLQKMLNDPRFSQEHHGMSSNPQPGRPACREWVPLWISHVEPLKLVLDGVPGPGVKNKGLDLWSFMPLSDVHNYILSELISYQGCSNCGRSLVRPCQSMWCQRRSITSAFYSISKRDSDIQCTVSGQQWRVGVLWLLPFLEAPDNSLFLVAPSDINASFSDKWKISL